MARPGTPIGWGSWGGWNEPAAGDESMSRLSVNPLSEGLRLERRPEPSVLLIFGASGDLVARKLVPALYSLSQQNLLPARWALLGTSRTDWDDDRFRAEMKAALEKFGDLQGSDGALVDEFLKSLFYIRSDTEDAQSMGDLKSRLEEVEKLCLDRPNRLFYLSTPPSVFATIAEQLKEHGIARSDGFTRVIVEKPFGTDLQSMRELNRRLLAVFDEEQIYRIDHYLGKETVQNILVMRFANAIYEPLWNRHYIDHVQITAAESIGVGKRGGYYDRVGALRDMIQNHLFQVFSLMAMEPPVSLQAGAIRDEKTKVVRAVRPVAVEEIDSLALRAQYTSGSIEGGPVPGYREEERVDPDSSTETYAAVKLRVDSWRWAGVPFYLRSAKRLPRRASEVVVHFKPAPHALFGADGSNRDTNRLILRIQPDEGVTVKFRAKLPGQDLRLRGVNMDFDYGASFGRKSADAYQRLLLDAMLGDPTLFARGDLVEASWELLTPILESWQERGAKGLAYYEAGTWGPAEADRWLAPEGRAWRRP